jgi:acyl phosphate:glycerol-3-phosphate acyltransferase
MKVIILVIAYLLGSLPVGRIVAKCRGVDIEKTGSGNVGATNVARSAGISAGLITLAGDIGKGMLGAGLGYWFFGDPAGAALTGTAAVFGHCLSIPRVLKGGKGVATSLGVITVLSPWLGTAAVAVFAATFLLSRTVSISSIAAALVMPFVTIGLKMPSTAFWAISAMALLIVQRHHSNISRLIHGDEPQFSFKRAPGERSNTTK